MLLSYIIFANGWIDVHGAGAQQSYQKKGKPDSFVHQGDAIRIYNFVRLERNVGTTQTGEIQTPSQIIIFTQILQLETFK